MDVVRLCLFGLYKIRYKIHTFFFFQIYVDKAMKGVMQLYIYIFFSNVQYVQKTLSLLVVINDFILLQVLGL